MFVIYEMQGDDEARPTWMGSSRVALYEHVTALFQQQATFSAVREDGGKVTTLATGYESVDGYQALVKEQV